MIKQITTLLVIFSFSIKNIFTDSSPYPLKSCSPSYSPSLSPNKDGKTCVKNNKIIRELVSKITTQKLNKEAFWHLPKVILVSNLNSHIGGSLTGLLAFYLLPKYNPERFARTFSSLEDALLSENFKIAKNIGIGAGLAIGIFTTLWMMSSHAKKTINLLAEHENEIAKNMYAAE